MDSISNLNKGIARQNQKLSLDKDYIPSNYGLEKNPFKMNEFNRAVKENHNSKIYNDYMGMNSNQKDDLSVQGSRTLSLSSKNTNRTGISKPSGLNALHSKNTYVRV